MANETAFRWWRSIGYVLFASVLFYEWMVPLEMSTDTGRIDIFVLAFVVFMLVDLLRSPWWLQVIVKPFIIAYLLYHVFFYTTYGFPFFSRAWLGYAWESFIREVPLLLTTDWIQLSPFVRTVFFFLFIWLMQTAMYRYVVKAGRVLWIIILTVFYLSVLDSFTPFDGGGAMVRTFGYGFVMLAFSRLDQLVGLIRFPVRLRLGSWFAAALAFVLLAVSLGLIAPKTAASWPDPVSFITSYDERASEGSGTSFRKVGYSEDDTYLGGGFKQDPTVAFVASIADSYYWRGESKSLYDGHGWFHSDETLHGIDGGAQLFTLFHDVDTKTMKQNIQVPDKQYSVLFTAGQLTELNPNLVEPRAVNIVSVGDADGYRAANGKGLSQYQIEVVQPILNEAQLRETSSDYPDKITDQYLQLPDDLPERVKKLAQEIVRDANNPYDKVKAIEQYLKLNPQLQYDTEETALPPKDRDFVDHFLFDMKQGYCDHFSTTMVVLLRASGIPARWVKGFAPGEQSFDPEEDLYRVTVRNSDAHSWPEVYFSGIGWLPFEPTPTFDNPTEMRFDIEDVALPEGETPESELPDVPDLDEFVVEEPEVQTDTSPKVDSNGFNWASAAIWTVLSLFLLIGVLWLCRHRLRLWRLARSLRGSRIDSWWEAYERLLHFIGKRYGARQPQQTVREYVVQSDLPTSSRRDELIEITKIYEQTRYGRMPLTQGMKTTIRKWWKRVIARLRA